MYTQFEPSHFYYLFPLTPSQERRGKQKHSQLLSPSLLGESLPRLGGALGRGGYKRSWE